VILGFRFFTPCFMYLPSNNSSWSDWFLGIFIVPPRAGNERTRSPMKFFHRRPGSFFADQLR